MMSLKYKLGDVVVLGANVGRDHEEYFTPGIKVRIDQLHDINHLDEHYTVYRADGKGSRWWVEDSEINHKATEELQKSNETGDIVGKGQVVSNDNAKEVRTPVLEDKDENGWFKRGELPPVGTVCEATENGEWKEVKILAHTVAMGFIVAVYQHGDEVSYSSPCRFRPIKTAEQIAEEEREKAITYMINRFSGLSKANAVLMYDAGYRLVDAEDE